MKPLIHSWNKGLRRLRIIGLVGIVCWGIVSGFALPAQATIREFEESPGQVLVQSRQNLQDQHQQRWQTIVFKRTRPDGQTFLALRLVGFPGAADIDRSQPLQLQDSLGNRFFAADASTPIFTDPNAPEPHIGQYDLRDVISQIRPELPLELVLVTKGAEPIRLQIAPQTLQEWKQVAQASNFSN